MAAFYTIEQDYFDHQSKKTETFPCGVECIEGKDFCLFHDENYLKDSNHPENKKRLSKNCRKR